MPLIKPFAGLRPAPGRAAEVAAPPYDVMDAQEARAMVADRPWSFLHCSRSEVDLPPDPAPRPSPNLPNPLQSFRGCQSVRTLPGLLLTARWTSGPPE